VVVNVLNAKPRQKVVAKAKVKSIVFFIRYDFDLSVRFALGAYRKSAGLILISSMLVMYSDGGYFTATVIPNGEILQP